jgi:hypothetical protein
VRRVIATAEAGKVDAAFLDFSSEGLRPNGARAAPRTFRIPAGLMQRPMIIGLSAEEPPLALFLRGRCSESRATCTEIGEAGPSVVDFVD